MYSVSKQNVDAAIMRNYIWKISGTQQHCDQPIIIIHIGLFDTQSVSWDAFWRKSGLMTNNVWSFFVTEATCNLWSLNFTLHQIIFVWGTLYRKTSAFIVFLMQHQIPKVPHESQCLNTMHWQQRWNNVPIFELLINPKFRNGGFPLLHTLFEKYDCNCIVHVSKISLKD